MRTALLDVLCCPQCRAALTLSAVGEREGDRVWSGTLACAQGHRFAIVRGVPRFAGHTLDADQARTRDSFGYEWTTLYPAHGWGADALAGEREIFSLYTHTVPSDFRGRLILDAGCGNGRYARIATEWGARVVAVDISDAVETAARNLANDPVDVVQADLFRLPFRAGAFDAAYSVGVLHHTPDAAGAFRAITPLLRPGAWFGIFVHCRGNRVLYTMNRLLRGATAHAPYRVTWWFARALTALGLVLTRVPFVGPLLYMMLRQVFFFSPDQHNNFDHYSAGFASFHRKEEVREWYRGWDDVVVRWAGVASESIYARGTRPAARPEDRPAAAVRPAAPGVEVGRP